MKIIADLHLHSKYSRAVSKQMVPDIMAKWGKKKGIDLLGTGDFFHSLWFRELQAELEEVGKGIYGSKKDPQGAKYILSAEISSIYSQGEKGRRVHTLVLAPSLSTVEKINGELLRRGCNLSSDGRPIVGLSCIDLTEIILGIDERCMLIPCHVWTPWFSLYGSKSGFDSVEECFGKYADKIYAVETGLSSDPLMNWKIKDLERRAIVSFSDAHSPAKLGREATVFVGKNQEYNYDDIYNAIAERYKGKNEGKLKIGYTIEFYPEEGKYHWTGHRKCEVVQSPKETREKGMSCHVCGRPLTVGVEHRVDELADAEVRNQESEVKEKNGVKINYHRTDKTRPPYVSLVPLVEILSEAIGVGVNSKKVVSEYERLVAYFGDEFRILLKAKIDEIKKVAGERIGEAVYKVRQQDIAVSPGYDGEFGVVKIYSDEKEKKGANKQISLF